MFNRVRNLSRSVAVLGLIAAGTTPILGQTAVTPAFHMKPIPQGEAPRFAQPLAVYPLADTFKLHSRPGSNRVIYLDFDGQTLTNTIWNDEYNVANLVAQPFNEDGNAAAFSNGELTTIQRIWQRVAEDYAPLNIDVTTEDPGTAAITRSGSGDTVFGTKALISDSNVVGNNCSCSGVAYVGVFDEPNDHAYYQPAMVISGVLDGYDKWIAETVSHEVGHNLGLGHDSKSGQEYYNPTSGVWAPIMGESFYRPLSQWSKGEYSGATNTQNDFTVMANNGGPLMADAVGNTTSAATALPSGTSPSISGLIETAADVDVFSFSAPGGSVTFNAKPADLGPNLDIKLDILDGAGAVIATNNPTATMPSSPSPTYDNIAGIDASITTNLAAGTYFLRVDGVGQGSPTTAGGYSDYGSVGRYFITGTLGSGPPPTGPSITVLDVAKLEGSGGVKTSFAFQVKLSAASTQTVTVVIKTTNGSAVAPGDFVAKTQTITFSPGQVKKNFAVKVNGDNAAESNETFTIDLSSPTNATIADNQAVGTIRNDD